MPWAAQAEELPEQTVHRAVLAAVLVPGERRNPQVGLLVQEQQDNLQAMMELREPSTMVGRVIMVIAVLAAAAVAVTMAAVAAVAAIPTTLQVAVAVAVPATIPVVDRLLPVAG